MATLHGLGLSLTTNQTSDEMEMLQLSFCLTSPHTIVSYKTDNEAWVTTHTITSHNTECQTD